MKQIPTTPLAARAHAAAFVLPSQPSTQYVIGGVITTGSGDLQVYSDVQASSDGGVTWNQVGGFTPFAKFGAAVVVPGNGDQV